MSRYLSRVLAHDEKILYSSELHWIVYKNGIMLTALGAILGGLGDSAVRALIGADMAGMLSRTIMYIAIAIIAFGAFELIVGYIRQISTELVITDRRVIAKFGFVSTTTFEVMLGRVEGANVEQSVLGRFLGFGTLLVRGMGGGIAPIDHVDKPYEFHTRLLEAIQKNVRGG